MLEPAPDQSLTVLSVKYGSSQLLKRNAALVRRLNPSAAYTWIAVNNDLEPGFAADASFRVIPGATRRLRGDRGSYHHAAGLMLGLAEVRTRFVLLLDHDFFVVRPGWIADLLEHMQVRRLGFFGSVWHGRWSYQPRDFPSVHFLLIDLEQVPVAELDFTPGMDEPGWDRIVSHPRLPLPAPLRQLLQVGGLRDTGFRVARRFQAKRILYECLQPHFDLETALKDAHWLHRFAHRFLPDHLSVIPKRLASFTPQSFLREDAPLAYRRGWEEFFWQGEPFAFHLRGVGRDANDQARDFTEVTRLLESYGLNVG